MRAATVPHRARQHLCRFHNHGAYDIDVYLHSLTKYASGHGDVMGGAIIARHALIAEMRRDFAPIGARSIRTPPS